MSKFLIIILGEQSEKVSFYYISMFNCIMRILINYPEMTVEYNGEKFKVGINELNWFESRSPGERIGNSQISTGETDITKEMDSIFVNANDILNLSLSYDENISGIESIEIIDNGKEEKRIPIPIVDNTVRVPEEKGEKC